MRRLVSQGITDCRASLSLGAAALLILLAFVMLPPHAAAIEFSSEIRPILSDKCYLCHGPDAAAREADLRLDAAEGIEYAFAAGDFEYSEAWRRITSKDPDEQMPPADHPKQLTAAEIDLLKRWMNEGATWSRHWSFEPPQRPSIPQSRRSDWGRNEIDAFVLAGIEAAGLSPATPADAETLVRRLTLDLTGLPPTIEELDAYLTDDSPRAYEKLVDRLLESPRFGERMAADWLDLARYSDTFGYQVDRDRYVWPWRDWVVRAFNSNLPYDKFASWQLAGDLIADASDDQVLATTFNRLHPQKVEGGSIPEEFRVEYVADRVNTFATGFLGLTFECCRCHDHKYDPFTQRDYYSLYAFFNNIDEAGLYSYHTSATPTPTMSLLSDVQKRAIDDASLRVRAAEQAAAIDRLELREAFEAWLAGERRSAAQHSQSLHAWVSHVPGLKVAVPSTPYDAKGLMKTAIRDNNPVVIFEDKMLFQTKGNVPEDDYTIPFGVADVKRKGTDITLVATSSMVQIALEAADQLAEIDLSAEVIDPRTTLPLDKDTFIDSAKKTSRAIVIDEGYEQYGTTAEIASVIADGAFYFLDAPVKRMGAMDVPIPFSPALEDLTVPTAERVTELAKTLCGRA